MKREIFQNLASVLVAGSLSSCAPEFYQDEFYEPTAVYTMMESEDAEHYSYYDPYASIAARSYIGPVNNFILPDNRIFVYSGEGKKFLIINPYDEGKISDLTLLQGEEFISRDYKLKLEKIIEEKVHEGENEKRISGAVIILLEKTSF